MDNEITSYAGIDSLRGYSYQIKVFMYFLTRIQMGEQVEYETIDDINISKLDVTNFDDEIVGIIKDGDSNRINSAIQVKRTKISDKIAKNVLFNWILLESNGGIVSYKLYTDAKYENEDIIFNRDMNALFNEVNKSNSRSDSLISQVKSKYGNNKKLFIDTINEIKNKHSFVSLENIDEMIYDALSEVFHKDGVVPNIYELRIIELFNYVVREIFSSIDERKPYVCTYSMYRKEIENICVRVSNVELNLDYGNYINSNPIFYHDFIGKREYKQLEFCELSHKNMLNHLRYKEYYQYYRLHNMANNKVDLLNNIEQTSSDNFEKVKDFLKHNNQDTPYNRLNETESKINLYAKTDQIRDGALIYLTKDEIDKRLQISWKDEEDG